MADFRRRTPQESVNKRGGRTVKSFGKDIESTADGSNKWVGDESVADIRVRLRDSGLGHVGIRTHRERPRAFCGASKMRVVFGAVEREPFGDLCVLCIDRHWAACISEHLANTEGTLIGNKLTIIKPSYDIPVASYDDFLDACTAALHEAFVALVLDNPGLIRLLDEAFQNAVAEYTE